MNLAMMLGAHYIMGNRIFLISNMYPNESYPFYGIFVKNTEEVLKQNGYVTALKAVITKSKPSKMIKLKSYLRFYAEILRGIFKAGEYDIIYVHFISHSAIPVLILKLLVGKPLVLNTHGSDVLLKGRLAKILGLFNFLVVRVAEKVVVPSEFFKDVVIQKLGVSPDKIIVYPSGGINTEIFKYEKKDLNDEGDFVLGYVSRIDYEKGCHIFVEVVRKLVQVLPHIKIKGIMIGDGKDKDECLKLIREYNLNENIEYLGALPQREIARYYPKFDLFVFPTRLNESLGLVGLEAMACGTPVVASAVGGPKTYIEQGQNGYLVDVDDVDGFVRAICHYVELSKEEKERIIENAYRTALRYENKKVTEYFIAELKKLRFDLNADSGGV
nr:MAG: GlcNAc transferase [Caldicoprobacter oshimai]